MKNALLFSVAILLLLSARIPTYDAKNSTAEVEKVEGIYIFYRSKPVNEYEYLGTHKIKISWTGQPDELFDTLVKKAKKKYPNLEAIIVADDLEQCDAIKFKSTDKFKSTETSAKKE